MDFSGQKRGGDESDVFKMIGFPLKRKLSITLKIQTLCAASTLSFIFSNTMTGMSTLTCTVTK